MKNTLSDLNNYLFERLEVMMDPELEGEDLDKEIKITEGVIKVSDMIIKNADLALKVIQHNCEYNSSTSLKLPALFEMK